MKIILLLIVQVMLITSLVYPEELHKNNGNLRVESLFKGQGQRPVELLDAMTGLANPEPDSVKDSPEAFEFSDPSQGFKGIDFDHFLYCQNLLAGKKIPLEEYERMVESGYIKKFVDEINRDSYNDPRFEIKVIDQNKNPRMQAILEAVSNSLDSLGLEIGQFGWGVKQILSWLEATGIDRIDVWTSRGDKAYQLTILKDCAGQNYIQIKPVLMDEFRKYSVNGAGNGTTVKVSVKRKISSPENIIGLIRGRFPFIKTVNITTQIEDGPVEKVNGFKIIKVIVPKEGINYKDKEKGNKSVHIAITENTITISDNGRGMDAEKLSKMFVPNEGDKTPKPLSAEDIEAEKKKIEVVHISAPDKKVLFSRNGEVIFSAKVPVDIVQAAAMEGGLIVELGRLMSVERSRDNIVIPFNLQGKSGMEIGIEYAIDEIINNQDLTYSEKAGYINTIIIGLDGLIESNENYAYIVRLVRIYAQSALKETIDKLRQEGYVILPHDKQFEQLLIPKNRKAFFLHEKLFDWQGAVSLKESGAEIIPGIERAVIIDGMEFSQPVAMAPFKKEILEQSAVFNPLFNNSEEDELMPLIKTEQFIAVPFTPGTRRLLELARKREKGDLGKEEEEEYKSLVERLNILTAQEVVTSNEVTTPKKNINLSERTGSVESGSGIDADAINSFLVKPLFIPRPGQGPSKIPSDARQKYIMTEKGIMEIGTGRIVADPKKFHIGQRLEPVAYGYYEYSIFPGDSKMDRILIHENDIGHLSWQKGSLLILKPSLNKEFIYSPDKRFAVNQNDGTVLDLENGILHFLNNNFSRETDVNAEQVPKRFTDFEITPDSKSLFYTEEEINTGKRYLVQINLIRRELSMRYEWRKGDTLDGAWPWSSIYTHPRIKELTIDKRDPEHPVAIDKKTGAVFHYYGEVIGYYKSQFEYENQQYLYFRKNGKYYAVSKSGEYAINGASGAIDSGYNSMFVLLSVAGSNKLRWRFYNKLGIIDAPWPITEFDGRYSQVSFDGRYFVFSDPKTGDVIYFDQEKFRNKVEFSEMHALTFVPASPEHGQAFKASRPSDAPNRFIVIENKIYDTEAENRFYKIAFEGGFDKVRRINPDTFIFYKDNSVFEIRDFKLNEYDGINVGLWKPPAKIELSASDQYAVYEDKGSLFYKDFNNLRKEGVKIAGADTFQAYRVHDRADVVILKDRHGKYSLFSLELGRMLVEGVNRIDIDSTGVIAVIQTDADSFRIINLKTGEDPGMEKVLIVIRSDEKDIMVLGYTYPDTLPQGVYLCDRKTGKRKTESDVYLRLKDQVPEGYLNHPTPQKKIGGHVLLFSQYSPIDANTDMFMEQGILVMNGPYHEKPGKFIYRLTDLETDKKIDGFPYSEDMKIKFFKGGKVFYAIEKGEVCWFYTLKNRWFHLLKSLVNESKTFILDQQFLTLFDIEGNEINVRSLIEPGFIPSEVNGDYFVFFNPETKEVRHLDPNVAKEMMKAPSKTEDIEREGKMLEYWNKEILSKRKGLIERIKASYEPFLGLMPKAYKNNIEKLIRPLMEELYKAEETEIRKRFKEGFEGQGQLDLSTGMAFEAFSVRIPELEIKLEKFLASDIAARLSQEEPHIQSRFYANLFSGLFRAAMNPEINIDKLDSKYFYLLGLGWKIDRNAHIKDMAVIDRVISRLSHPNISEEMKISEFMSVIAGDKDEKKHNILIKKLTRLLANKEMFKKFERSFKKVELKKLLDFLENPQGEHEIGDAKPFVIFLSNDKAEFVKEKKGRAEFNGEDISMPPGGAEVSQLIKLETQRPKKGANNLVMSMNYLIGHINELPERSGELEADILHNATIQAESGAYTREISQNSKDIVSRGEMRDVEVDVEYYLQKNESGQKEYVEEARDNGTGALQEIALLIPKSTKAGGRQKSWGGFFGTGKYTIFEDADRLEIITKNKESAWLFNFDVTRNDSGAPVEIRLTRIQKINDPRLKQGVTIRRVKLAKNTIPMLDQMLSERAWKIFAGLSQDGHFKIFFIDYKGARKQLFVEKEELSRVEFKAVRRGERGVTDFGTLSIIRTKDMPLQVLDKEGRRVKELNDECLALIPQDLRKHVKELGINIRIPLPLIHTRSAFEYEDEYMPIIQRYIAIAFYKAIAYKTMKQPEAGKPQFIFEGFPADWETDETYWASLVPGFDLLASLGITKDFWKYTTGRLDERLARLVTHINQGEYEKVRNQDLEALLSQENKKLFIQLVILLNSGDTSLLDRRVALQIRATQEREGARGDMLFDIGGIPFAREKLDRISIKATLYKQAERLEDFIIDPVEYTTREKGFVEMALGIARNIGFSNIVLMDEKLVVPGAFREGTIYLRRTVARLLGESDLSRGVIDSATDTIIHELAHYLEDIARLNGNGGAEDNKGIYNIPEDFYTHTARGGIFDKAMRYIAWLSLANYESEEQGIAPDSSPINLTVGARHDL